MSTLSCYTSTENGTHLLDDLVRFVAGEPDVIRKAQEVVTTWIKSLAGNRKRVPSVRTVRPREIVKRRQRPASGLVHEEGDVLQVVVTILAKNVERDTTEELNLTSIIARQGIRQPEYERILVPRHAEIGMQQPRVRRTSFGSTSLKLSLPNSITARRSRRRMPRGR